MANYNLTNQPISASFQQLLQKNDTTGQLVNGTGSIVDGLEVTGSFTASFFKGDGSGLTNISASVALPSGVVSGSSQIILQDTTGDLSGSRITGDVSSSISASYAISSSQAENADNATTASLALLAEQAIDVFITVKNTSGGPINKGLAVHATGVTGENINVILADSSVPANMPAIGLLEETLGINATGRAVIGGRLKNVDTSTLVAGQSVYVNGAGVLTTNKPTGSDLIQAIGVAGKIDASEGEIIVQGAGRTNDLPNIQDGYAWVGNVDHVPTAVSTASWDAHSNLSELNAFTASQELINSGYNTFTSSADGRLNQLEADTGSQDGRLDNLELFTSSQELINTGYNTFTSSADGRLNNIESTTASLQTEINGLSSFTGSYATTGSNRFIGTETIDGTLIISQSASTTGSIMHFPLTGGGGLQGIASNRFYNVGPNLFEQSYQGIDKYILQTVGTGEMEISAATSMVLNPATSGNGNLVSTKIMTQQDSAPATGTEKPMVSINGGTTVGSVAYPIARTLFADYSNFSGNLYEDYFGVEIFGTGYAYGTEQTINGRGIQQSVIASGSGGGNKSQVNIIDNYNGTSQVQIVSPTQISLNGKINVNASVQSSVPTLGISAQTASIDFSAMNLWELTLANGVDTHLNAVNVLSGQTLNILVKQNATGAGTLSFSPSFLQPDGSAYVPSTTLGAEDVLTLMTYNDTSKVYVVAVNKFV